jgi:hypothetical protein
MRVLAGIVMSAALLTGLVACGGGDDNKKQQDDGQVATEFGTAKPEDARASAAEVADGLTQLGTYADEVVAKLGVDDAAASETQDRLLTIWESILGTVKANDEAAYQRIGAALDVLMKAKGADAKADAQDASVNVHKTGEAYLAKFPGTGSAAPTSSASPDTSADDVPADAGSGGTGY